MYPKEDEEKIKGHSISRGMNNPSITAQLLAGKNLLGDEPEVKQLIDNDEIRLNEIYFDTYEKIHVAPIKLYDDKVQIHDYRSCTIEYAKQYWELVI